ncbi:sulfatase [Lignipirellula cremea]|uniref:Arylsulfatase n=1 Tax=Lignipirellula cremea TaxID=2528010 RepID=A0A518DQU2_9BACT|nr:sulfatase [Lignipirellula cremea]QDU94199.1 Arylsulfatase [Lignipirellula cremea]
MLASLRPCCPVLQVRLLSPQAALLLLALAGGMLAGAARPATAADNAQGDTAKPPNVIVILADDLGFGDLSCYGATDLESPALDGLLARGMRFDNFYANCCVCSPTRASLMTGQYPEMVGVPGVIRTQPEDSWGFFRPFVPTLPDRLQDAGYHTALVGKWHLGLDFPNRPTDRGFDHFHGFLGDMMDDYYHHRRHDINYMREGTTEIDPEGHATDLFTTWACDYLKERAQQPEPFFLYLAYNAPHTPIQPPADWLAKVKAREPEITDRRAKLVALIEHMDDGIGKVLACLKEQGLEQNTLVIFTSDNGGQVEVGANNGPWRDGKQSMYEGGLRVPFIAVWPDHIQAGSRCDAFALTMDIFPTVCAAAGVVMEEPIDGASFLPQLQGDKAELPERDLYFHRREGNLRYNGLVINAVRRGDWKLLQNSPFAPQQLYNLADDPAEETDLARDQPARFRELSAALRRQLQRGGAIPWQPSTQNE